MNAIVPRATIEQIVACLDAALVLYATAYDKMAEADEAVKSAAAMAHNCHPGQNSYNYAHEDEQRAFLSALTLPDRDRYLRTARKLIDINAWAWIIERTDLERLMDAEAKKTLRNQMAYVPDRVGRDGELITDEEIAKGLPELTVENIQATLQTFAMDADMIFKRGLANSFSKLDRRFRSHDGFKLGSRVILTYAFNTFGSLQHGQIRDVLIDIERVFAVLDGKPEASFTSAIAAIQESRRGITGAGQSEVDTDYFKIRGFKNGNAHLWFQRDDLVLKANKLLAEYYGEKIGDGNSTEEDPFADVKNVPARYFGFFPTPERAAAQVFEGRGWRAGINVLRTADEPQLRFLEPSAGTGNLARRCFSSIESMKEWSGFNREETKARWNAEHRFDNLVDVVELQPHLAAGLESEGIYNRVFCQDFLTLSPETTGLYDYVVMNPPFDRERDIDHVVHALKFLKPGGRLRAIMSAGTEFRETKKAIAFRALVEARKGSFEDLPPGSFAEAGTYVNTCIVTVEG